MQVQNANPGEEPFQAKSKDTIIANDEAVNDKEIIEAEIKEPPHGDWLVVACKKKPQQGLPKFKERNKDHSQMDSSNRFEMLTKGGGKSGPQPNMFAPGPSGTKEVSQTPFNPKKWAKKRPRRDDHAQKKDPVHSPASKEAPKSSIASCNRPE